MAEFYHVDPALTNYDVMVYEALLQAWNDIGVCPSYENLQHACMCSAPTVRKAVTRLKAKGYITARKFQVRSLKPTDMDRHITNKPRSPWDDLAPPRKFFKVANK